MKVGFYLPQFRSSADETLSAGRYADSNGIDGLFAFDHLYKWDSDGVDQPVLSCFPLLGALAAQTSNATLGTLAYRVGVASTDVAIADFSMLNDICDGRLIAGIGIGDAMSKRENEAYGVATLAPDQRVELMVRLSRALAERRITTWFAGRSARVQSAARDENVALNMWQPREGGMDPAPGLACTWAGRVPMEVSETVSLLRDVECRGFTWAVCLVRGSRSEPLKAAETIVEVRKQLKNREH